MKKIYLALGGLLTVAGATAQTTSVNANQLNTAKFSDAKEVAHSNLVAEKGTKAIHFTEDFESGTFPPTGWAVSSGGASTISVPAEQAWHEEATGNPGSCASVLYNNSADMHDEWITTPVLDLSSYGSANMRIEFEFNTSQYWHVTPNDNADITLEVSLDGGTTFTSIIFQEDDPTLLGNALLDMDWLTYTWTKARTDISSLAAETNVVFGFHYLGMDGAQFNLDNISIVDIEQNDLSLTSNVMETGGVAYYSVPLMQIQPINFSAEVTNIGVASQSSTTLTVTNGGTYTGTSTPITLAAGASDSSVVTTAFTPASAVATHTLDFTFTSANTDDNPANNSATETLNVTDWEYARDKGTYEADGGGEDGGAAGDFAFEAGNDFEIFASQQAYGIDVVIGTNTPVGTIIYGKIYEFDGSAYVYIDETAEYTTTSADASSNATIVMPLLSFPTLTAGSVYTVVVGCYSEFYYGTSGYSPDQTSFILYGGAGGAGSQYYTNETPMVRVNFDPSLGLDNNVENTLNLGQNVPNPANNTTAINYSVKSNANVNLTVTDMTGKVVMTVNEGTKAAGDYKITLDASTLAGGLYHYTLSNGETSITKTMSVVK